MSLFTTLLLSLIMPSFLFRFRPLFSTCFTSLTVYLLGFLGYVASHKELQCYNKEEISVKYMIPLIGVYEWYSWKFVILLTVLVVATFVVHRDEIEL